MSAPRKVAFRTAAKAMATRGDKMGRELRQMRTQLAEAEYLIRELCSHEGAEGWSECLRKRLDAYKFTT